MDIKVANFRKGPWNSALAFFDVVFDNAIIAKGFVLRQSSKDNKYYWQPPSKLRTEKSTGKPVKDEKGWDIYDPIVDIWGEKKDGKFTAAAEAWEVKEEIVRQAVELYEGSSASAPAAKGRGGSKAPAKAEASAKAGTSTKVEGGDGEYDDSDDLPF